MRIFLLILAVISSPSFAVDSTAVMEKRLADLERKVHIIDVGQINYKIEKDLLKETYSNNYERINTVITFVLGLIGVIGFVGIKDIGSIKKEYESELKSLKELKIEFEAKYNEFDIEKSKVDEELKRIVEENQRQNENIKFLELKEKVIDLTKGKRWSSALEFANAALDLKPDDTNLLNRKGSILIKLNQLSDAVNSFRKALDIDGDDTTTVQNIVECLYFSGSIPEAKKIIEAHSEKFGEKEDGKLKEFLDILELYHDKDKGKLIEAAGKYINYDSLDSTIEIFKTWDLSDAEYFAYYEEDSEIKRILQGIIWFWNNSITGKRLIQILGLPEPDSE